ncbi:MAG: C-type lectin domain-containing protein [Myxococcales bacterium]
MALRTAWLRLTLLWAWSLAIGCGGESEGKTEVLVSIEAQGEAMTATSVRIEVNAAVVELPRTVWPMEVLVSAAGERDAHEFALRAFGLRDGAVVGGAKHGGSFKQGKRTGLELMLVPNADIGPLPAVNSQIGPDNIVVQPHLPGLDAGSLPGSDGSVPDADTQSEAGGDGDDADASPIDCAANPGACQDSGATHDACVPSPSDCGGCGMTCASDRQCVDQQCVPIPAATCDALTVSGRHYKFCRDQRSWDAARVACRTLGYDLAIINTLSEFGGLVTALANINVKGDYWLGGHDRGDNGSGATACRKTTAEGVWRWVDPANNSENGPTFCSFTNGNATTCTDAPGAYTAWDNGQPDNQGCSCGVLNIGACSNGEDCLAVTPSNDKWNDTACTDGRAYLCEEY